MEQKTIIWAVCIISVILLANAQDSVISEGGNITPVHINGAAQTERWQGFAGTLFFIGPNAPPNITAQGGNVNGTTFNVTSPCDDPTSVTGSILFSNSSTPPAALFPGNLTQLDTFVGDGIDNATRTFFNTSTFTVGFLTIPGVPTAFTHVNSQPQSSAFREGYFNDNNNNILFAVDVDFNTQGYDTSFYDFQAILPAKNKSDVTYFITTDLNITCPPDVVRRGGVGGGSGGGQGCLPQWECTNWSGCIDGFQHRDCYQTDSCPIKPVYPSTTRLCPAEPRIGATPTKSEDIIKDLKQRELIMNTPDTINAKAGHELTINATLYNPNEISIEQILLELDTNPLITTITPLHTNPLFYRAFNAIPLAPLDNEQTLDSKPFTRIRLNPEEETTASLTTTIPLIQPQTLHAQLNAYSGDIKVASRPINIKVETDPFTITTTKDGPKTQLSILIDNRARGTQHKEVEINFNNGRQSAHTELYRLIIPEDSVTIYGHEYLLDFDYDTVRGRYKHHHAEAR